MAVDTPSLRAAARDAYLYALPMTEIAKVRDSMFKAGIPSGTFYVLKGLATPKDRFVTTPNVDTIYANAFINLQQGPVSLTLPALGSRYGSLSLMSMFSDNVAVLGTRTTGQDGGAFTLVGPNDAAPLGAIRSPTPWVWALARVIVDGPGDVENALSILRQFKVEGPSTLSAASGASRSGDWKVWWKAANSLMLENPAPVTDRRFLTGMAALGLNDPSFDPDRFTEAEAEDVLAGMKDAAALIESTGFGGHIVGSWLYPAANTGNFFQDYVGRARIAVAGLAALPPAEATYLAAVPQQGRAFDGKGPWRICFSPDDIPPVSAFWSLTMYEAEPDGGFFLTENAIHRYTIGDRTPGLRYGADGSLEIWIARTDPGEPRTSNWLPAPNRGPFMVILRAYLPHEPIVAQTYVPPPLEQVD